MPTDGVIKRYTFKLRPNKLQAAALDNMRRLHGTFYNAALQERTDAYRLAGKTLTHFDQCKSIKIVRADDPAYEAISADSMSFTLKRLDMAFQAFFRRAKAGAGFQSGFPRYKRGEDYPGFTHRPGQGWRFDVRPGARSGRTTFKGVPGAVKWRGEFPSFPYSIKTGDVMLRGGTWWLSVVAEMPPRMRSDANYAGEVSFDLVDSFARVSRVDSGHPAGPEEAVFAVANGRITPIVPTGYQEAPAAAVRTGDGGGAIVVLAVATEPAAAVRTGDGGGRRAVPFSARTPAAAVRTEGGSGNEALNVLRPAAPVQTQGGIKRGSCRYRAMRRRQARKAARKARQRREALHVWTTNLARQFVSLKIVSPPLPETTKSGRGNEHQHGAEVALKAMLNRRVLDQAPGAAIAMLKYKIAERGGTTEIIIDAGPATIGNDIVAARKAARKLKRAATHAR
jgi:hypothetical protein